VVAQVQVQGRVIRQSSETDKAPEARRLLKIREGKATEGQPVMPRMDRVTVGDLLDTLVAEYTSNERRSLDRLQVSLGHLRPVFGARGPCG
jgi:hypothetical protein